MRVFTTWIICRSNLSVLGLILGLCVCITYYIFSTEIFFTKEISFFYTCTFTCQAAKHIFSLHYGHLEHAGKKIGVKETIISQDIFTKIQLTTRLHLLQLLKYNYQSNFRSTFSQHARSEIFTSFVQLYREGSYFTLNFPWKLKCYRKCNIVHMEGCIYIFVDSLSLGYMYNIDLL